MDCPKHENYINENGIINMKTYQIHVLGHEIMLKTAQAQTVYQ